VTGSIGWRNYFGTQDFSGKDSKPLVAEALFRVWGSFRRKV
jgi:hypothetical protein